jgi:hypothetical protein
LRSESQAKPKTKKKKRHPNRQLLVFSEEKIKRIREQNDVSSYSFRGMKKMMKAEKLKWEIYAWHLLYRCTQTARGSEHLSTRQIFPDILWMERHATHSFTLSLHREYFYEDVLFSGAVKEGLCTSLSAASS